MSPRAELLAAALAAAARGWPVFPLRPGGKRPALHHVDRCPGTGPCTAGHQGREQRATTDEERIRRAWSVGPGWNIGVATGPAGLVVVELDVPDPADPNDVPPPRWARLGATCGTEVLALLAEQAGQPFPETHTVETRSGGWHLRRWAAAGAGQHRPGHRAAAHRGAGRADHPRHLRHRRHPGGDRGRVRRAGSAGRGRERPAPAGDQPAAAAAVGYLLARHAYVSTWLNGGVPAPQVAEWAGHSVEMLLRVYAKCIDGQDEALRRRVMEATLGDGPSRSHPAGHNKIGPPSGSPR